MSQPRIDLQVARGFALLREPTFDKLVKYLNEMREHHVEVMLHANDMVAVARSQGNIAALTDFLDTIEKGRELVAKLQP